MISIMVAGAGRIGSFIAQILANSGDYRVLLVDSQPTGLEQVTAHDNLTTQIADVSDAAALDKLAKEHELVAVVACLPYFCNLDLAKFAKKSNLFYFDLTEDVEVSQQISKLAHGQEQAFVCRCGVAPGFINIVANHLMQQFDVLDTVKLRGGCLPKYVSNSLQYALAWSIDGLINEYGNTSYGIFEGKEVALRPLDNCEDVELDGVLYEAFNTSGGIGALIDMYKGKVKNLTYKTLRYPGHCEKMRFLMKDLHLNQDRDTLKRILLNAIPKTDHDVMIVYVSVTGTKDNDFYEKNYVNKILPREEYGQHWSAIQVATASSAACVIDIILHDQKQYRGFVIQETLSLEAIVQNRFGHVFSKS